jgi:hypothetical protein
VGDVVLVFDENPKRGFWRVGRMKSLVLGRDKVVRGAKVVSKGHTSFINRPVYING